MTNAAEYFMQRCLQLAKKGINSVAPNPMVGCVITIPNNNAPYGQEVIGEGYHKKFGGPHAEVNAVESVKDKSLLKNATAYVSLEPCSHFGKTPPCADLLVRHQLNKVFVASLDPNPKVAGRGVAKLKEAGILVDVNVLQTKADLLNRRFITLHTKKRPYVVLKWAQTQNGYINDSSKTQKQISNLQSQQVVHQIRSNESAIMVAKNTATIDNPSLTTRSWFGSSPMRILLDTNLEVPQTHSLLSDNNATIIVNDKKEFQSDLKEYIKLSPHNLNEVLTVLYEKGISSVLVEGGAQLLKTFIKQNLWDEAFVFSSQENFESGITAPLMAQAAFASTQVSNNTLNHYKNSQIN